MRWRAEKKGEDGGEKATDGKAEKITRTWWMAPGVNVTGSEDHMLSHSSFTFSLSLLVCREETVYEEQGSLQIHKQELRMLLVSSEGKIKTGCLQEESGPEV